MDLSHPAEELFGTNTGSILRRLAIVGEDLSGRRIAELSGVPVASAARVLVELEKIGLVTTRNIGSAHLYRLNRAHVLWSPIEAIFAAPARVEQLIAASVEARVGDRATVATFGSFARGDAGPESDIDILIVWDDSVTEDDRRMTLDAVNRDVALATGNPVDVVEVDDADLRRMTTVADPLLDSWSQEARILAGPDLESRLRQAP